MPVARLFLMWSYLEQAPNEWDFSLYDAAFRSAEKHHVRIVATLTPSGRPTFRGGDGNQGSGIVESEGDKSAAATYIAKVVNRYKGSAALDTWLLVNEPGQSPSSSPTAVAAFRLWVGIRYRTVDALNAEWGSSYKSISDVRAPRLDGGGWNHNEELDWRAFWLNYQTTGLRWFADEVKRSDAKHPLHLNPAGILGNLASLSDDLPAWRSFLDTLGCSIHPSWHFGLLKREQYDLGVSFINDLVRGSIEPKPYWVTELQGGNNIYSGVKAMEPTPDDIAQWTWTSIGAGADRTIYWLLNARRKGVEAGEWSMLDFDQQPSGRLKAASEIASVLNLHQEFFKSAQPVVSPVTLLLSLDTMTFEDVYQWRSELGRTEDAARGVNAHVTEALGFYEALSTLGLPPNVKHMSDYDWTSRSSAPRLAIVPDARSLAATDLQPMQTFLENGNFLIISGLTGFYGAHAEALPLSGFPLAAITGASLKEVHLVEQTPYLSIGKSGQPLPSRLWVSTVRPQSAEPISYDKGEVVATRRSTKNGGKVLWIPSPIGIGAWLTDPQPLARYLLSVFPAAVDGTPIHFTTTQLPCLLRVMKRDRQWVSVVTNTRQSAATCTLAVPPELRGEALWGHPAKLEQGKAVFEMSAEGTSVMLWH